MLRYDSIYLVSLIRSFNNFVTYLHTCLIAGLVDLNRGDINRDINQVIKKIMWLKYSCLYTLNPFYAKIFNTSTTHVSFEIVSVFIYSLIECQVFS